MQLWEILLVLVVGFASGFLNTIAGGGSLLSLPLLIFLGLPPTVANATNRVAVFIQNIFSVAGFQSKGVSAYPYSIWLGISSFFGGLLGAMFAVNIDGEVFNRILAVIMVAVILLTVFSSKSVKTQVEKLDFKHQAYGVIVFFFIGIYGGFIQAGVGFLMIPALTMINGFSLVKTNSAKVFVALFFTLSSLVVFIYEDQVNWIWGLILAGGSAGGGWVASRWSVNKGDVWIKRFLVVTVLALAIKLWFF
ncbi:sulfite exporter TauE/SafE family protein [Fulvivirgaceae bacterium LMO-SS25]